MFIACWSVKGGSGSTVAAASLALVLASAGGGAGSLLVDLGGDCPAVLGLAEPTGPGVGDWLMSSADSVALAALEVPATANVQLLPRCSIPAEKPGRLLELAEILLADPRPVVVDIGVLTSATTELAAAATVSLLVIRPCYLALRHAVAAAIKPSGIIVVEEPGRSLSSADIATIVGAPVVATVPLDPAIARAVDAGLLATRLPRVLERNLRKAA